MNLIEPPRPVAGSLDAFRAEIPGIYEGVSATDYFALPAVSSTILKKIHTHSPAHAKDLIDNGMEPSDEMEIGSAAHCLLFTPSEFHDHYVLAQRCAATTGKGQQCTRAGSIFSANGWFCAQHGEGKSNWQDVTILTPEMMERTKAIAAAIRACPKAADILDAATDFELSLLWTDDETGLLCKARLDIWCGGIGLIPDLKTCRSLKTFNDDAFRRAYHLQIAHYLRGATATKLADQSALPCFIAVENERPFDIATPEIDADLLAAGEAARASTAREFAKCKASGEWPGFGPQLNFLSIPKWGRYL